MNPFTCRCFYWLFTSLGCVSFGVAGYLYFAPAPGFALHVADAEFQFGDCTAGQKREVVYRLDNRSGRPMRILGISGC